MMKSATLSRKPAFVGTDTAPGALSAAIAGDLLAAIGDVALVLAADGTVVDRAVAKDDLTRHGIADWVGQAWIDTVTLESRPKIDEMLAAARTGETARWRQVNHAAPDGDVPIRYLVMPLDAGAKGAGGDTGRTIAIGRDMRGDAAMQQRLLQTQQALERDYVRLRQAEARYRLLFDQAAEAVLIVDATTRRIREANPAAHRLLDAGDGVLAGQPLTAIAAVEGRDDLVAHLGAAEAADDAAPVRLRLADRRGDAYVTARLFRQAREPLLIVRVAPVQAGAGVSRVDGALGRVVERMPDAFVLVDRALNVLTANTAFLDLAELSAAERAVGVDLGTWLGRPGIDLELIVDQLREHGAVRNVATILRGTGGAQEEVEVSGVVAPAEDGDCYGFIIRNVGRRPRMAAVATATVPRSVGQLTELVGRMSLKEIVRESTDMIERLCIEAALIYTSDNRASAAEILGVSRQSLYSKLHRFGLGNLVPGNG